MNVQLLRESFQKTAYKLELPTDHYIFSTILDRHYLQNKLNILSSRHRHITYEVRCLWYPDGRAQGIFEIIPPNVWHTGYFEKGLDGAYLVMFQFDLRPRKGSEDLCFPNAALDAFALLQETVMITDTFGGVRMMQHLRELVEQDNGSYEQIYLQFQQVMLALAKALPCALPEEHKHGKFLLSDFYPQVIEEYIALNYMDTGCSREQLAALLCISERQLIRIMDRLYGQTFRELLTEFRMEAAERWRFVRKLSAAENAVSVGFLTTKGFLKAYKQYHKKPYIEQT